jgi:hypothetical protein
MYQVKPISENVTITDLPTSMYKVNSFYPEMSATQSTDPIEIDQLLKHQEKQLRKLNRLQERSNNLCEELNLDDLIINDRPIGETLASSSSISIIDDLNKKQESQLQKLNLIGEKLNKFCEQFDLNLNINDKQTASTATTTTPLLPIKSNIKWDEKVFENLKRPTNKVLSESVLEDLAIQLDPDYMPVLLLSQINQFAANLKCFIKCHVHGSVLATSGTNSKILNRINDVNELVSRLKLDLGDLRSKYDFGFTFVWKKADKPENQISVGTNTSQFKEKICGEVNIMKHLNTLITETNLRVDVDALKKNSSKDSLIKLLKQF